MRVSDVLRTALQALIRHKLRSALAVLGIVIGVSGFISSVAVGAGASSQIDDQIRSLGDNLIWIEAGSRNVNGVRSGTHGTKSLLLADAKAIEREIPLVANVTPNVDTHVTVVFQAQNWSTQVRGVTPEFLAVRRWRVDDGRSFSHEEVERAATVCVLGQSVVANLFGQDDPVGQDQDDVVIMPFTTVQTKIKGVSWLGDIFCSAVSPAGIESAEDAITALLRQRHHVQPSQDDDVNLRHPVDIAQASAKSQRTVTLMLGSLASIALIVGGIGILNIMLVSVTERTREIGIRLAVGGRGRDILAQFLMETIMLTVTGGALGVALGAIGADEIAAVAQWQTVIRSDMIALALGSAGAVGMVFGFYPAWRASRLDPVEALRR